jgi:CheY-like chemotaxis protein
VEASDGRDALTKTLMHPPALIVTELRLPFIDGYALCERLRSDRATADVPILVVASDSRPLAMIAHEPQARPPCWSNRRRRNRC